MAQINNVSVADGLDTLCGYLPVETARTCSMMVYTLGPVLLDLLVHQTSPDIVCYVLKLCQVDEGREMCHLFPPPPIQDGQLPHKPLGERELLTATEREELSLLFQLSTPWVCYIPGVRQFCDALEAAYKRLVPALDKDNDGHSPVAELRGSLWRGKDCDDSDPRVHPGRKPSNSDVDKDSNCNGISGVNRTSGVAWEEELCAGRIL